MKKKGYYEFDPVIYPRKLWVHIGGDFIDIAKSAFDGIILPDGKDDYFGITYEKAERKSDKKYGILVSFPLKKYMTMGNISHESSHVVDAIEVFMAFSKWMQFRAQNDPNITPELLKTFNYYQDLFISDKMQNGFSCDL